MDFRKAFFPTKEEIEAQERFLKQLQDDEYQFWMSKGLTHEQYQVLKKLELYEFAKTHVYQYHCSRRSLLESGIIGLGEVLKDIENNKA